MGNKKRGYKYYLVVGGGNIVNYWVDIESALATGEISSNNPHTTIRGEQAFRQLLMKLSN